MQQLTRISRMGWILRNCSLVGLMAVGVVTAQAQTTVEQKLAALEAEIQQLKQELAATKATVASVKPVSDGGLTPFIRPAVLTTATLAEPEAAKLETAPTAAQEQAAPAAPAASGPMYYPFTPVTGIYTGSSDKDLGKLSGIKLFEGIKVRGWLSTYYDYNFNNPETAVVEALRASSVVKGPETHIEGRLFDTHSNSITLDLAEVEIEKIPDKGQVGFKLDIAYGDTQNLIGDTITGALGKSSISDFERTFQHASISYNAPIGKGLRFDFGKFVTHIGGETIESVKNANFSHGYFYTYAIPFQDYGMRMRYDYNDKTYTEFYLLNGWNASFDVNRGKTYGVSLGYTPSPHFSFVGNWMGGPEQVGNSSNWRNLGDFQIYINPTPKFRTMTNIDVARETGALVDGTDTSWQGVAEVWRYRMGRFDPSFRFEWYRDKDGFSTGVPQNLLGFTATFDYFLGKGEYDKILVRPEFRYDHSNGASFFSHSSLARSRKYQTTVGLNLVYYF